MKNYSECPNLECQSQWGIEEISFQECDCCGYPNHRDNEDNWADEPDYEYDPREEN